MRDFVVTFLDDPPERAEAVDFFCKLRRPMCPAECLPDAINELSQSEAQSYLDSHPVQQKWLLLRVLSEDHVADNDLARLRFVPELEYLFLYDVGDDGLQHTIHLKKLTTLAVYSSKVTDACLAHVLPLTSLETIDFQGSPNVSENAFAAVIAALPNVISAYPPWRGPQ